MHLKRGENPFKSSKRTESDRRERDFDKAYGDVFYFLLRSKTWVSNLLIFISLHHFLFPGVRIQWKSLPQFVWLSVHRGRNSWKRAFHVFWFPSVEVILPIYTSRWLKLGIKWQILQGTRVIQQYWFDLNEPIIACCWPGDTHNTQGKPSAFPFDHYW